MTIDAQLEGQDTAAPAAFAPSPTVDANHPWLGLASFTEETREYFHGREEEVAELARRVQRKLLTVLFGQSGLGKTSILRAGLVPRLRPEGYCPVYVRIDYAPESPTPAEQIKQAIIQATRAAGAWTQPGVAVEGESLWEFLHHRDDVLYDQSGRTLVPLLIFDQFEEIFTIAQSDDAGRQRAAQFLEDLADLVENRAPKALEAKLDEDDEAVAQFDFARADYRILIALREDYLAHLEGVKSNMPSITQNRMRLARMTGAQALSAVMKPGGRLVTQEVAEAIVRFIAGGAELRNAEVEPSLLSLICRELNNARIAQGRSEISADLLAGSRDTILSEFYERALGDQPAGVRQVIEDNLLTESGFRESLAEERLKKLLAGVGAPANTLAILVNRRLLRIEERLDVRRVELTHDVLCGVVKTSRDLRIERENLEAAEKKLAEQRARELATRQALLRARRIALGCAFLAVVAVAGAIFGYVSMRRAQQAEAQAQHTRALAEQARGEAEKLMVYLLDDFYLELEPVGRLDVVAALAKRAMDYYEQLPAELRTRETERNRALAMVRYGASLRYLSRLDEGEQVLTGAIGILDRIRAEGDNSEGAAIGLALALSARARTLDSLDRGTEAEQLAERSDAVIAPFMAGSPSIALRRAYGAVEIYQGFAKLRGGKLDASIRSFESSRAAYRSIAGLALTDLSALAGYVEATAWLVEALTSAGKREEADRAGEEGERLATTLLEKRPAHMGALRARALIVAYRGKLLEQRLQLLPALELEKRSMKDWQSFLQLDPGNAIAAGNLAVEYSRSMDMLARMGRFVEARASGLAAIEVGKRTPLTPSSAVGFRFLWCEIAQMDAELGNVENVQNDLAELRHYGEILRKARAGEPARLANVELFNATCKSYPDIAAGNYEGARKTLLAALPGPDLTPAAGTREALGFENNHFWAHHYLSEASFRMGDYAAAEKHGRQADVHGNRRPDRNLDQFRELARNQITWAASLARLGRQTEAQQVLAPALKLHRELNAHPHDDALERVELARALYALSLADSKQSAAALKEAADLVDKSPESVRRLKSVALLRSWIAEEQRKRV
jgi:hypothetical protein